MRVIQNNDVIEITCSGCKSRLAINSDDVQTSDIGHGHSHEFWINCSVCGKENGFSRNVFPNRWLPIIIKNNNIED